MSYEDDILKEILGGDFGASLSKDFDDLDRKDSEGKTAALSVTMAIPSKDLYQTVHDLMMILQTLSADQVEEYYCGVGYIAACLGVAAQKVRDGMVDQHFEGPKSLELGRIDAGTAYSIGIAYLNLFYAHATRQAKLKAVIEKYGMEEEL